MKLTTELVKEGYKDWIKMCIKVDGEPIASVRGFKVFEVVEVNANHRYRVDILHDHGWSGYWTDVCIDDIHGRVYE